MAITPVDILHTQFKTALRGYGKAQVDEFVQVVRESLEEALAAKSDLQQRADALQEEVDRVRKIESTMTSALTLAQRSADELRANAHRQAEMIMQEAEQARVRMTVEAQNQAEKYRAEVELLRGTVERFESEFRAILAGYQEWLDRRRPVEDVRAEVA